MSILVIQGPHPSSGSRAAYQQALIDSIKDCAGSIGTKIFSRTCSSIAEISESLGGSCPKDTEMVLLDSGDLDAGDMEKNSEELCSAINRLQYPYIEVHDDSAQSLDSRLSLEHTPMVTVIINNNLRESYALAMAIAARRLHPKGNDSSRILHA